MKTLQQLKEELLEDGVIDAEEVKELLLETFTSLKEVLIFDVGCVIGAHTGPGTVAMYYIGKKRK